MDYNEVAKSALDDRNVVGSVQKIFGTKGEVVIKLWDTFPDDICEPLWVEIDSLAVPVFVKSLRSQGQAKAVAVFDDFESVELAEMLVGRKLYSLQAQGEDAHEDYSYLKSFVLRDLTSGREFAIVDYIDCEYNPLLELDGGALVPISEELIEKVDQKRKRIEVRLADGIFDL